MHRVHFDRRARGAAGFDLSLPASRADLARIGPELRDGLGVMLYSPGDCEMEAELAFDAKADRWLAIGDEATLAVLPSARAIHAALNADRGQSQAAEPKVPKGVNLP